MTNMTNKILKMYNDYTSQEICNILGISMAKLNKEVVELVDNGLLKPKSNNIGKKYKPRLSDEQKDIVLNDYFINEMTRFEIAEKYDINTTTLDRLVKSAVSSGLYKNKPKGFKKGKYKGWQLKERNTRTNNYDRK